MIILHLQKYLSISLVKKIKFDDFHVSPIMICKWYETNKSFLTFDGTANVSRTFPFVLSQLQHKSFLK